MDQKGVEKMKRDWLGIIADVVIVIGIVGAIALWVFIGSLT